MEDSDPVVLFTSASVEEAHLVRLRLESAGIEAHIVNEHFASIFPHYSGMMGTGVQVYVRSEDFDRARNELQSENAQKKDACCPHCGSYNVRMGLGHARVKKIMTIALSLLAWIPFGNISSHYVCRDCKEVFDRSRVNL